MNILAKFILLFPILLHCMVSGGESQFERFTPYNLAIQPVNFTIDSTATMHKMLAYSVILSRSSLKYVQYVCVDLLRMPCLRTLLHRLVKKPGEIYGLVDDSNLHLELIEDEIERLLNMYEDNDSVEPIIHPVREIQGSYAEDLFHDFRFYVVLYDEAVKEDAPYIPGLAFNLYYTLAIGQEGVIYRFPGYGNYESFGLFLSEHRLSIRSEEDANKIWCAFCEIHLKSWAGQPIEKVSDTVWHLGLYSDEHYNYYYEVILDSDGLVQTGVLQAIRIDI